jgi:hypothetical protein
MGISDVRIFIDSEDGRLKGYTVDMRKPVLTERDTAPKYPYSKYRRDKVPLAFCLPEVCRQIYSETAVLAYTLNTFIIDSSFCTSDTWASKLLPAQRNSIKYILLPASFSSYHILDDYAPAFKRRAYAPLQNLRHIRTSYNAWVPFLLERHPIISACLGYPDLAQDQWKPWIMKRLKEKEGEDVEIEFEEEE